MTRRYPMSQYEFWDKAPDKDIDEMKSAIRAQRMRLLAQGIPLSQTKNVGKAFHDSKGRSWFSTDHWTLRDWITSAIFFTVILVYGMISQ